MLPFSQEFIVIISAICCVGQCVQFHDYVSIFFLDLMMQNVCCNCGIIKCPWLTWSPCELRGVSLESCLGRSCDPVHRNWEHIVKHIQMLCDDLLATVTLIIFISETAQDKIQCQSSCRGSRGLGANSKQVSSPAQCTYNSGITGHQSIRLTAIDIPSIHPEISTSITSTTES